MTRVVAANKYIRDPRRGQGPYYPSQNSYERWPRETKKSSINCATMTKEPKI